MPKTLKKPELLNKEEERALIAASQEGSQGAQRRLMEHNQGLVHKIVQNFPLKNSQVTYDDLWQVGCMGFLHAVEMFDLERDVRLSTYAYRWIHAYIRRYYQNQGRVVRVPAHLADKKYQMDRKIQNLTHELGYSPSSEELEELVPGYDKLAHTFSKIVSLNQELESGDEVLDLQIQPSNSDVELEVSVLLDILKDNVSDRDYEIFVARYGVDGRHEHTLNEVADVYGLTRSRIHQVTNRCLTVIREVL